VDITRRRFLVLAGTGAMVAASGRTGVAGDPFTLGVASGDPWPNSVVLWTRLAPRPLEPLGGIGQRSRDVEWQIAADPAMTRVVRHGHAATRAERAHSVHVIANGLLPGRDYWYRFRFGPWLSPIARTKTAPAPAAPVRRLDLAAASCQRWSDGFYTAHRHLASEAVDVVLFLGDYVYEHAIDRGVRIPPPDLAAEADSLERYRMRYALYKLDPDLQAAHHSAPWIVTWDDHEVANDYGGESIPTARRVAAYQAFWEHQPLRVHRPQVSRMTLHRRFAFGSLAELHVLDTRQHRAARVEGDHWQRDSPSRRDPRRSVLGPQQEAWLARGLRGSSARWNVLGQQVIAGHLDLDPTGGELFNVDAWDGYPAAQRRLHGELAGVRNPVVLTGDVHAGYALDIVRDRERVAVELAATSISSGGDGASILPTGRTLLAANAHLRYVNQRRGYLRCRLTPEALTADFRTVPFVGKPGAPVATDRSFSVPSGARHLA
jgi:alkaline phosphatase D